MWRCALGPDLLAVGAANVLLELVNALAGDIMSGCSGASSVCVGVLHDPVGPG